MNFIFGGVKKKEQGFADAMIASFPKSLPPPEPFLRFFYWLEDNRLDDTSPHDGHRYARIDPDQQNYSILVEPVDPRFTVAWSGSENPAAAERMAAFVRTGGDGSYAGLWRNDDGAISLVHHGSGSGSTMLCKLTDDPIDFLRLLAIGYEEVCWPDHFELTPEELHEGRRLEEGEDIPPLVIPHHFRRWVVETFNVTIPQTASEIVLQTADMDAADSIDPFWRWIRSIEDR